MGDGDRRPACFVARERRRISGTPHSLQAVADEADRRGYRFVRTRIGTSERAAAPIPLTTGQLRFEARHLAAKLAERAPETRAGRLAAPLPPPHPLFRVQPGPIAAWERSGTVPGDLPRAP